MSLSIKMDRSSIRKLEANLEQARWDFLDAGMAAGQEIAEEIMAESRMQIPRETGAAAESGFVEVEREDRHQHKVRFGYGGAATRINPKTGKSTADYIVPLHERLDTFHPNGNAKFLENPVNQKLQQIEGRLGSKLRKLVMRLFGR